MRSKQTIESELFYRADKKQISELLIGTIIRVGLGSKKSFYFVLSFFLLFFTEDEGISGTKSSRPALDRMIAAVNNGEISSVIVYSFSRFARSTTHLLNALQIFKSKNVAFVSITEKIDTSTPVGLAVFSILAAISQLERDLICERVKAGLANARAKGKIIGRKKMRDSDLIRKLLKAGMTFRQIAQIARCSHGSVWAEKSAMMKEEATQALIASETPTAPSVVFPEIPASTAA